MLPESEGATRDLWGQRAPAWAEGPGSWEHAGGSLELWKPPGALGPKGSERGESRGTRMPSGATGGTGTGCVRAWVSEGPQGLARLGVRGGCGALTSPSSLRERVSLALGGRGRGEGRGAVPASFQPSSIFLFFSQKPKSLTWNPWLLT